ncbi:hypothetical protein SEUCBS140593_006084 [Sporothrix eucalyptigena]|uniref:FHA domain-containing protein n=1 Tax=Sporothrix eucalyptigena TaxID=1812306 RepID=A0ABP0C3U5_9PEZI
MPTGTPAAEDQLVRHIRLTAEKPKVNVGRASKTVSKGLVPAVDNAYFDSPVVSRAHAEIAANFEDGTVSLTDMGSLHGTSVNDKPLEKGVSTILGKDDIVSFGIHVSRGLDVFYPMACKVVFTRSSATHTERARSYCAPDSEDGLSDGSDCDCSSVHSQSNPKPSTAQNLEAIDDDESSDVNAAGDMTMGRVPDTASDYGEVDSIHDNEELDLSDSEIEEDDGMNMDEEDDELEDEDENEEIDYEDEEDEAEEEEDDEDDGEDAEGDFLDQELRGFNSFSVPVTSSLRPAKEATPSGGDPLPVNGLWTPPSVSAEDLVTFAACAGDDLAHTEKTTEGSGICDAGEMLVDPTPRSTTTKFDISSILNPSPPTSSPPKAPSDDEALPALCVLDTQEVLDATASWGVYEDPTSLGSKRLGDVPQMTSALADTQNGIFLSPIVADIASRVGSNDERSGTFVQYSVEAVGSSQPAKSDNEPADDEDENAAVTSVATYLKFKKQKEIRKRKAEEMLADAAASPLVEKDANTVATTDAVSAEEPASKRQATLAAVAAKKNSKGRVWAAAEKIGIAALGGAVVLGSLIYTAPSF